MGDNHGDFSRRRFISTSLGCLASAGLAGAAPTLALAQTDSEAADSSEGEIIYRSLGRSGLKMPIISMGEMNANNPGVVQAAFELGIRHFDTAAWYQYGRNEQILGSVLAKLGARKQTIIGTKVHTRLQRRGLTPEQSKEKLIKTVEGSLKRLRTDYIDILYLHDVGDIETVGDEAIIEAMTGLKKQGKALAIGISTHQDMANVINAMASAGVYDVVVTSFNFTMADDTALLDAIKNAAAKGMGVVAMKTLAGGARFPNPDTLRDYSSSTIATACLKWVLRNGNITTAIPGFDNHEHLREDFSVARNLEYTEQEHSFLSDNNIRLSLGFCRQCRRCLATCPQDTDIPTLMRTHMYAAQYANFYLARATLDEIPAENGLKACSSCEECTARCANSVDIPSRINELKMIYA